MESLKLTLLAGVACLGCKTKPSPSHCGHGEWVEVVGAGALAPHHGAVLAIKELLQSKLLLITTVLLGPLQDQGFGPYKHAIEGRGSFQSMTEKNNCVCKACLFCWIECCWSMAVLTHVADIFFQLACQLKYQVESSKKSQLQPLCFEGQHGKGLSILRSEKQQLSMFYCATCCARNRHCPGSGQHLCCFLVLLSSFWGQDSMIFTAPRASYLKEDGK